MGARDKVNFERRAQQRKILICATRNSSSFSFLGDEVGIRRGRYLKAIS
jgi:hypothetical protein